MNRKVSLWFMLLLIWIFCFITMFFGWSVWYILDQGGFANKEKSKNVIMAIAQFPSLVNASIRQLTDIPLVVHNKNPEVDGLKLTDKNYVDSNYVLLSAYDKVLKQSVVKLIRLSDQKILHQWTPDIDQILKYKNEGHKFSEKGNRNNINLNHPLLSSDGSIVFNTEDGPLMKLSKDSKFLWHIQGIFHHSLEFDADGNIWSTTVAENSKFMSEYFDNYRDDAISKISPDGKILFKKSVSKILVENGYRGLLLGIGPIEEHDALHLNDIQPALTSSEYWQKGDLLISIRNKSTIFLYHPSTNKILWLKTGPWLLQHDVDFIDDTHIGLFGNNLLRNKNYDFIDGHSDEYIYDFKTDKVTTPYSELFRKANIRVARAGLTRILANGDIFIEESDNGRLLRGNTKDIIWQFVERIDKDSAARLCWSRFITKDEIKEYKFLTNK